MVIGTDTAAEPLDAISVVTLKGVGEAMALKLASLGIHTLQDVLFHLPFRYQDRTRLSKIGELSPGSEAVISAEVMVSDIVIRQRRSLMVRLNDGTGSIMLRFFHFNQKQVKQFERGARVQCFGEVRRGPGMLEMVHPEYRVLAPDALDEAALDNTLTPFYHATEGVQQATLRKLTDQALKQLDQRLLRDFLPASVAGNLALPDLRTALHVVHRPPPGSDVNALMEGLHPAHRRLAFEELVAHRLGLRLLRVTAETQHAPKIRPPGVLAKSLRDSLAFNLTGAQDRVLLDVLNDMGSGDPMLRLVQGDVGSGKTIVAALAAAQVVECGYQVAMMAPTEILAEQHMLNFSEWFESLGIEVGWLTGKLRVAQRRATIEAVATGQKRIVIGTHALFQKDVQFQNLGLAIIDEQHRFGVHQRMALRNKGADENVLPHQLIMTATPIPRTLAMTAYADLDVSVIDELPPGRKPVTTVALENGRRGEIIERVGAAIDAGSQVYWVCTLIEESESLQAEAAEDTLVTLQELLPRHRIGLVHGRLKPREKEAIMQSFKSREIDLLVATTVIEVGVDVPNASLMIIENAERLGLSQLHQLRGRVGRGSAQSSCILLYQTPLSNNGRERLGIMRETNDGFIIAEKDLSLRGAGEVLGTRQTGLAEFRIAELGRDDDLLDDVSEIADLLLDAHPEAVQGLVRRWIGEEKKDYGGV
ncbi:ATP-dependent DNA helicase RecG [Granulosicoccus antarcticus]|uniref:ATP-dependent DNA helicase RecG n=1 Tax=Granulosicoccus antarcticus IMCC3135 TaxID=1192854 RepID=A0A2Z2P1H6_9GAMM|nr:ATP-dependent DNA helicase RecG [Granulosicoccus antarcticus]ASJ76665.1 ATP-dependent DNA helicase RecG [Granulosicoccus antarcticus IMCC3135]